ncbi:hypothetical protein IQ273_03095 [Nodosilinea sp. LEGE 07298]|uniref:hypothetical protein n=1 Tax=Nodosilinea sp. LEGE 07298 TaxID=2777970 RepID=UPI001882707C|nr:hypothetical protein [Nodosilinea sp. LEGE 07298]MBE9108405.1 hypothetical protein [Nodosilinea sp. LEGE 07298]
MMQDDFNVMDLLDDDAWFEASARREESVDCEALAGYGWGSHLGAVMANPKGYSHFTELRSMVMQAWQQLVTEWDLGIGTEAAEVKGQELVMARLHQPEADIQETLMALLEAKLSKPQGEWEMTETVHTEIRAVFGKVLSQEDWKAIAESTRDSIYAQVLKQELFAVPQASVQSGLSH